MFQTLAKFSSITPSARGFGNSVQNAISATESFQEATLHALRFEFCKHSTLVHVI